MKLETLTLANRISTVIKQLETESANFNYTRHRINSATVLNFTIQEYVKIQNEANEKIQLYLKNKINDLNCFLEGLCDETYPIILPAYKKYVETDLSKEDNEDDDEATPVKKAIKKPVKKQIAFVCPEDGDFGDDFDDFDECDTCPIRNECRKEYETN